MMNVEYVCSDWPKLIRDAKPADVITGFQHLVANGDFLIAEVSDACFAQVMRESENMFRLEYLDNEDGVIYATDPELLPSQIVERALQVFSAGGFSLARNDQTRDIIWKVGPYQPDAPISNSVAVGSSTETTDACPHANGYEFEEYVATVLQSEGWETRPTRKSGDQGLDVLAFDERFRVAIQCKRYSAPVGNSAVQEAHAAADFIGATHAVLVATAGFTRSATELAEVLGVVLVSDSELFELRQHLGLVRARSSKTPQSRVFG